MTYTSANGDVDLEPSRASGWVGWVLFAAMMMIVSGIFDVIWGIVGLARSEVFVAGPKGNVISLDYTAWGWINLLLGIVLVAVGVMLLKGSQMAMMVALAMCVLSAIDNLLVIGAYPIWSTIVIALDVLVIYAICMHGQELTDAVAD